MSEGARWQLVAAAVAAALAVIAAVRLLDRGGTEAAPVHLRAGTGDPSLDGRSRSGARRGALLYVHVAGAVSRPGLYRVPAGARVAVAVRRAGGAAPSADLTAVNLAARLEDGQQVLVPVRVRGAAVAGSTAAGQGPISLATATAQQLEELDGIGPTLAERIIEFRDERGGVRSLRELDEVDGIGEKRLESLEDELRP